MGRTKNSRRNKGFSFRSGRGWLVTEGSRSIKPVDQDGHHITDRTCGARAEEAYRRYALEKPNLDAPEPLGTCPIPRHFAQELIRNSLWLIAKKLQRFAFSTSG